MEMYKFFTAWKGKTHCEGCSTRFNVLRRKKPCFSCKNYFCPVCIMQLPDKKMCCRKCQILTATPLDRNDLLNLRSRDLVNYLTSKHISTSGCVEKEDLVNVLMGAVNNSSSSSQYGCNSGNSSYSSGSGSNLYPSCQNNAERQQTQSATPLYCQDGIRIIGRDLPESDGSSLNQSPNSDAVNESECVDVDENVDNQENLGQADDTRHERISNENSNQSEVSVDSEMKDEPNPRKDPNKPLQLSDISCTENLDNLSIKELKKLLITNRTDFTGCIERAELLEKASRLWTDYTLSRKDLEKLSLEELCKICMDAPIECVLLECGHMATCMTCGKQLTECPVCRQFVVRCVRTFKV